MVNKQDKVEKKSLRIDFVDFWQGFNKTDNFLFAVLSRNYELEIGPEPDLVFFSCYGVDYLKYNCTRVFYTAENMRPDFLAADYALTFDFLDDPRHYRLPLYAFYLHQRPGLSRSLTKTRSRDEARAIWRQKTKFCCMVVSNGLSKKRLNFFHTLSAYKTVDSGGRYMNNVGGPVADKLEFIRDYRFVISFENSSFPGYTTEKILDPLGVDSIPVYWGNPRVGEDFNKATYINYDDFGSDEKVIEEIIRLDNDEDAALQKLIGPKFSNGILPSCIREENVERFLDSIVGELGHKVPVARTYKRQIHALKRRGDIAIHYLNKIVGRNFR